MIIAILTILHIVVSIALILIVLLQTGKGSELAGAFGGGTSNTAFGVTGSISFIGKMTTVAAFCFLFTSFCLSLLPKEEGGASVIKEKATQQAPQSPLEGVSTGISKTDTDITSDSDSNSNELEKADIGQYPSEGSSKSIDVDEGSGETDNEPEPGPK